MNDRLSDSDLPPLVASGSAAITRYVPRPEARASPAALVPLALAAVYGIWGSSYIALRIALESLPPFMLGASRFLVAGTILYAWLRLGGVPAPTRREWFASAKLGALFLVVGSGSVGLAGRSAPACMVAVIGATVPILTSLFAGFGQKRASRGELSGIAMGAIGVAMLNLQGDLARCGLRAVLLFLSPLSWAIGTVWSRSLPLPKGPMATAAQLLVGGVMMSAISIARDESAPSHFAARTFVAMAYLTVCASLIGFTAYGYLIRNAPPAIATSHAYVNPIIAIALGASVGGDHPSQQILWASAIILAGVAVITVTQLRARAPGPIQTTLVRVVRASLEGLERFERRSLLPAPRPSAPPPSRMG